MKRLTASLTSMLLISAVISGLSPGRALAGGNEDEDRPIVLRATAGRGPIGRLAAFARASINGRTILGEHVIWGGELLRAEGGSLRVRLDFIGQVTLKRGAVVKLARSDTCFEDDTRGSVLIASVVTGEVRVRLERGAIGYVEAAGQAFTSTRGASFRMGVRQGEASLETYNGQVTQQPSQQRKYFIRPVGSGAQISVRERSTRQIQVQVTDENDRPVPDVPVIFLVQDQDAGSLGSGQTAQSTATVTTNSQGIATTSFTAGPAASSTSVTATVVGTSVSTTIGVTTTVAAGILTGTTIGIIAAAAAGTVATLVTTRRGDETVEPIQIVPPTIRPRR